MENVKVPTSKQTNPSDSQNDNKENKLHSLKEVPKKGFVQIKESFRTLKNVNRQPIVKADKGGAIRFMGDGVSFKAKLIGILEVNEARGDRMCQEALFDLKMAIRAAGEHKQRITINVAIDGLKLRDEKTGDCLYHHPIHKISFIAQDLVDSRAFGYIFGSPDTGHRFFGIKTDKAASQVVITMRDLFQTVFELKKQEIEMTRQQQIMKGSGLYLEALASTTSKNDHANCNDDGSKRFNRDLSNMDKSEFKNTTPNANDLLSLELELNNLQQGLSQMESITPPPSALLGSDPFGDSFTAIPAVALTKLPPPPSSGERRTRNSSVNSGGQPEKHWFDKETESIFSLTNSNEVHQAPQTSEFKVIESTGHISPTIKCDAFDVFTELDPLGTGRSKPYVDKKDFFQELKNPPKKILNQFTTNENEKMSESHQNLPTKAVSNSFSSDLSFKDTSSFNEDPFKNDNFNKSHDSNSAEMEFADFSSFEGLKPVSPQLQQKSPLLKSDSSSSQNSVQGLLKVSLPPETQKPYNISTSPKYNLMSKNRTKLKMRKSPSPDYYRNEEPTSPDDDYAIMKLMTLPQRIDIAPEPPPRPSSSLEPPPLPPKKQQIPFKNVKPVRTRNSHYDYIENYVSSYNIPSAQQESEAPPLPLPSRKPKIDTKKKKEDLDSEYYLLPVSVEKPSSESKSNVSTSLDITLSQLTKTGFSDLADTLKISPTSLSKMTIKELTLHLSKLEQSSTSNNEETQSAPKKTEEDKKEPEKSLYDKYAVFRELLDEEKTSEVVLDEDDKYAALRDIPVKEPCHEETTTEDFSIEKTSESNLNHNVLDQAEVELVDNQVFELEDKNILNEVVETKTDEDDENEIKENEEVKHDYGEENRAIRKEDSKNAADSEVLKENLTMMKENTELIENSIHKKLFDNSQCWATFDAEPKVEKKVNSPWSADHQESQISKPKVNIKKVLSNRSKCSSSWDDCEESEDNWDNAKRSLESSIEDFPRTVNGWSDGESMYEDESYYERKPSRRSNRKISPRLREPSPWDEGNRYNNEWEPPYMYPPHWRLPHIDDERRRSSKDDKRRIYARPDIDRRIQKLPSTPNWEDEKYQRMLYERRRRYLEEQYNWDRYGPPIPKGFKNYPRPPPVDNSDDDDVKMRYRLPKKNRYVSSTTPRKPRRSYHRRSEGSDEDHNIPPRKPYSQEELDLSESELEQNWSRKSKNKWPLKRNQTSPFDDDFTPESPDSSVFAKTMSTCSDLGYLTKPSPSTSSKTNRTTRKPKRSDSGHRSIDSSSKSEATKRSPYFEDDFTPDNVAKSSMSSEFSFKDDDVFTAKDVKIPREEVSSSPKEMKKSESINIFSRNVDPFEDDDFFTQDVSSKPNLASLEEDNSDHEEEEWDKQPDRTKNE